MERAGRINNQVKKLHDSFINRNTHKKNHRHKHQTKMVKYREYSKNGDETVIYKYYPRPWRGS
jgi:hypothetical protein